MDSGKKILLKILRYSLASYHCAINTTLKQFEYFYFP